MAGVNLKVWKVEGRGVRKVCSTGGVGRFQSINTHFRFQNAFSKLTPWLLFAGDIYHLVDFINSALWSSLFAMLKHIWVLLQRSKWFSLPQSVIFGYWDSRLIWLHAFTVGGVGVNQDLIPMKKPDSLLKPQLPLKGAKEHWITEIPCSPSFTLPTTPGQRGKKFCLYFHRYHMVWNLQGYFWNFLVSARKILLNTLGWMEDGFEMLISIYWIKRY